MPHKLGLLEGFQHLFVINVATSVFHYFFLCFSLPPTGLKSSRQGKEARFWPEIRKIG